MTIRVGVENGNEGYRSIAWALEHPGCFSYGSSQETALGAMYPALAAYVAWIARREPPWVPPEPWDIVVEDVWTDYTIDEAYERVAAGYEVNAWFQHDWKPLTSDDIARGAKLLAWSRADLLATVEPLPPEWWGYRAEGERWDIGGIVQHIAGAERWYLDRLGLAFPRDAMPSAPLERLAHVREYLSDTLPALAGLGRVMGKDGEFWSPRKLLRRALWHERDHTAHIRGLLEAASFHPG